MPDELPNVDLPDNLFTAKGSGKVLSLLAYALCGWLYWYDRATYQTKEASDRQRDADSALVSAALAKEEAHHAIVLANQQEVLLEMKGLTTRMDDNASLSQRVLQLEQHDHRGN